MTIEQAYATMSYERPSFDWSSAAIGTDDAAYLRELFDLIDLAVKERVDTLAWLQSEGREGDAEDDYDGVLDRLASLHPSRRLDPVHRLITDAITQQRDVLRHWRTGQPISFQDPLVQSSSQKLHQAYNLVLGLYPGERQPNRHAFYIYFCSLDFL